MLVVECHFCLQSDLLMFRSDAPMSEVHRPLHQTPSSHLPFVDSHLDPVELDDLMDEDSDGGAALVEDVKGKAVESLDQEESPEPETGACCPKKPRTTVRKRRARSSAR